MLTFRSVIFNCLSVKNNTKTAIVFGIAALTTNEAMVVTLNAELKRITFAIRKLFNTQYAIKDEDLSN